MPKTTLNTILYLKRGKKKFQCRFMIDMMGKVWLIKDSFFGRKSKQPLAQTNIRRWRLETDKKLKYKDCVCSPDGSRIAYWTNETITLYDDRSGLANTIPYRRVQSMGSRMSSTDSQRESTLTVAGQFSIADWSRSWRSVRLTDRYLIAATTHELFNVSTRSSPSFTY